MKPGTLHLRLSVSLFFIFLLAHPSISQNQLTFDRGPVDKQEFERWLDQFVADYAAQTPRPSLGFVMVKNEKIFFEKGYGDSPSVTPNQTLFRAASVSKIVTATALMQLVERGLIALDADVNTYLKTFKLENTNFKSVMVSSLLTHTSGIEDTLIGNSVPNATQLPKLGDYFSQRVPRRIRPPNVEIAYSNRGMTLAGHLVEAVSGLPFEEYVERNIFEPLGMMRSSFRQPYPAHVAPFVVPSGADEGAMILYPSGSMITTVEDMGHFISAHLNNGKYGDAQILSAESVREMHRRQFSQHPQMPGIAYGFFENHTNGRRVLFHTGLSGHQSILCLMPEERIGFYLVLSVQQGDAWQEFRTRFLQAFMNRYFPQTEPPTPLKPSPEFQTRAARFAGIFRPHLLPETTIEKIGNLVMDTKVIDSRDGSLRVELPPFGAKRFRLVEVSPLLFRTDDGFYFAFAEDANGNINRMFMSGSATDPVGFERLRWFERGILHLFLGTAGFLLSVSFVVFSLIDAALDWLRRKKRSQGLTSNPSHLAWRVATLFTFLIVLSPVVAFAIYFFGDPEMRPYKITTALYPSLSLLMVASLLGLTLPVFAILLWRSRRYSVLRRVYYSLVAVMGLLMPAYLYYWNLLGFRF